MKKFKLILSHLLIITAAIAITNSYARDEYNLVDDSSEYSTMPVDGVGVWLIPELAYQNNTKVPTEAPNIQDWLIKSVISTSHIAIEPVEPGSDIDSACSIDTTEQFCYNSPAFNVYSIAQSPLVQATGVLGEITLPYPNKYPDVPPSNVLTLYLEGDGIIWSGGGILYKERYIITAKHVINVLDITNISGNKINKINQIAYILSKGLGTFSFDQHLFNSFSETVEEIAIHPSLDLGIIKLKKPVSGIEPIEIGTPLEKGSPIVISRHGGSIFNVRYLEAIRSSIWRQADSDSFMADGKAVTIFRILSSKEETVPWDNVRDGALSRPGDSGLPAFNIKGELTGIVIGGYNDSRLKFVGLGLKYPDGGAFNVISVVNHFDRSYFVDLTHPQIKKWIEDATRDTPPYTE